MRHHTQQVIERLQKVDSEKEALSIIVYEQEKLKNLLMQKGVKFEPENSHSPQGVFPQRVSNSDYSNLKAYEEINFISRGLIYGWYDDLSDQENFHEIQEEIMLIFSRLN